MTNQTKLRPNHPRHVLQPSALVGHHMLALWVYFATNKQTDQPNIQLRNQTTNQTNKQTNKQPNIQLRNRTTKHPNNQLHNCANTNKQPNMTQELDQQQMDSGLAISLYMAYTVLVLACGFAGGVFGLVKHFSDQRYQRYPPHGASFLTRLDDAFADEAISMASNLARYCILGTAIGVVAPLAFLIAFAKCLV